VIYIYNTNKKILLFRYLNKGKKMKTKIFALLLFVLVAWFIPGCYVSTSSQDNGSGYNSTNTDNNSDYPEYNNDDLNQYGEWVNVNQYGRVWYPSVVNDWQPFTNGHWTWDGNDWVWVSYEPFGWIVYHYGSWENSPEYGWIWIPSNDEWSPANVQWIDYGDNIGWAPRRANNRSWPEPWENNNVHPWMVVKIGDFNRENINSYRERNVTRVENVNQTPIQRRQPDVKTVQRYVKEPIGVVKFEREPVVTNNPPLRTNTPKERTTTPPERTTPPPDRTPPPERTYTPPEKTTTPPVISRNTTPPKQQKGRQIVRMQVPPTEKQKVDKYRPKVEKEVLIKKNPKTQK
jgi:hypothetical protein